MKGLKTLLLTIILIGCNQKEPLIQEVIFDYGENNAEPNLVSNQGELSLSWIQSIKRKKATLFYSNFKNQKWQEPIKITSGKDWFVNWADFPANATNGNILLTSHLQKSDIGTYTYDIVLNLRSLEGEIIKENFLLNTDGIKAEHGFVSVIPNTKDGFLITWLDGRNTVKEPHKGHHKAMTIRTAEVSKNGNIFNEIELDGRTCDCCQTSIAMNQKGPIIVYRDRSKHEIRDVYFSQKKDSIWSKPKPVFNDQWKINGCPVNGPKIVSNKINTAVAWFTIQNDLPKIKVAFLSNNSTFNVPIKINDQIALGRVDAAFISKNQVLVSYMETEDNITYLRCKKVSKNGNISKVITISQLNSNRNTGVPQLEVHNNFAYFVWTIHEKGKNQLKSVRVDLKSI